MIGTVKGQLFKLKDGGLCQKITWIHVVGHSGLGGIIPAALCRAGIANPAF